VTWVLDGNPVGSVLVTRLRYLGDIVMSTVVLEILKMGDPDLSLGYLCESIHAPVLAGHPALDRIHALDPGRRGADAAVRRTGADAPHTGHGTFGMIRELRRQRYDLAVDLFFNPRSAWLLRLAGIRHRIGGTRRVRRHLYTHAGFPSDFADAQETLTRLAPGGLGDHLSRLVPLVHRETGSPFAGWLEAAVGQRRLKPQLTVPVLSSALKGRCAAAGVDPERPFLLLAPGATWRSKEWPVESWRDLVPRLAAAVPDQLAILTPPGGRDRWSDLASVVPRGRGGLLPTMGLADVLAVVGAARALVTVDGGIMHAAVGMSVPTVALFGPTDPAIWFPYVGAGPYAVLATAPWCHPCDLHDCPRFICLPDLAGDPVVEALASVLSRSVAGGRPHD